MIRFAYVACGQRAVMCWIIWALPQKVEPRLRRGLQGKNAKNANAGVLECLKSTSEWFTGCETTVEQCLEAADLRESS